MSRIIHNIGFIGCGARCDSITEEVLESKKFKIAAYADISDENSRTIANKYNLKDISFYNDYREMLKDESIELVVITSPDYCHEEQAIEAFKAGKHVFLEKPVAVTMEGAEKILKARDESGKKLLVGFVLRYHGIYTKIKEIISSGMIGELTSMWVLHSVKSGGDWYFHDWHGLMQNTSGLLLQKGSHDFDIMNWMAESKAKSVYAIGSRDVFGGDKPNSLKCTNCPDSFNCTEFQNETPLRTSCVFRQEIDVLDNHFVIIEYENGIKGSYNECHYTPDDNREFTFIGTKGKIISNYEKNEIIVRLRHKTETITYNSLSIESKNHGGGDKGIVRDLINMLENDSLPFAGGEEGIESIKVGLMAHESIRTGKVVCP